MAVGSLLAIIGWCLQAIPAPFLLASMWILPERNDDDDSHSGV